MSIRAGVRNSHCGWKLAAAAMVLEPFPVRYCYMATFSLIEVPNFTNREGQEQLKVHRSRTDTAMVLTVGRQRGHGHFWLVLLLQSLTSFECHLTESSLYISSLNY
jgi:hypothetical protein